MNPTLEPTCDEERLMRLVNNELNASEREAAEAHLDACDACAQQVSDVASLNWRWGEVTGCLTRDEFDTEPLPGVTMEHATGDLQADPRDDARLLSREISGWLDPTDDPDMLGRFAGYEICGIIGHGGMGIVLKGFEKSLNRYVAIKVLAPRLATNGAARQRFFREAQAAAAVRHVNVIAVHRVDRWHDLPFLVMPYVAGESLQSRIDREGPLGVEAILRIAGQIASGLAAAHAQGLVHRDIKPANILLENGVERVTITDFGLARAVDDVSLTRTGFIAGTPRYMSPEQTRGGGLDHRSDLFSLGSVMYAMVTGRAPFRSPENHEVLRHIAESRPRCIRDIEPTTPVWMTELIEWLQCKSPDDRPQSAEAIAELLEHWLAHLRQPDLVAEPEHIHSKTNPIGEPKRTRTKWWVASVMAGLIAMLAGIVVILETQKGEIRITSEVDDVPIVIKRADKVVDRMTVTQAGTALRVAAGQYSIMLEDVVDGIEIENDLISVRRGKETIVSITHSLVPAEPPKSRQDSGKIEPQKTSPLFGKWKPQRRKIPGSVFDPAKNANARNAAIFFGHRSAWETNPNGNSPAGTLYRYELLADNTIIFTRLQDGEERDVVVGRFRIEDSWLTLVVNNQDGRSVPPPSIEGAESNPEVSVVQFGRGLWNSEDERQTLDRDQQVGEPTTVVPDPSQSHPEPKLIIGLITDVENNELVQLTVGEDDGVEKGMRFLVHSNKAFKGQIEIIKVKTDESVARIVNDSTDEDKRIKAGDEVLWQRWRNSRTPTQRLAEFEDRQVQVAPNPQESRPVFTGIVETNDGVSVFGNSTAPGNLFITIGNTAVPCIHFEVGSFKVDLSTKRVENPPGATPHVVLQAETNSRSNHRVSSTILQVGAWLAQREDFRFQEKDGLTATFSDSHKRKTNALVIGHLYPPHEERLPVYLSAKLLSPDESQSSSRQKSPASTAEASAAEDLRRLQGAWQIVEFEQSAKASHPFAIDTSKKWFPDRVIIDSDRFIGPFAKQQASSWREATIWLDATSEPKRMYLSLASDNAANDNAPSETVIMQYEFQKATVVCKILEPKSSVSEGKLGYPSTSPNEAKSEFEVATQWRLNRLPEDPTD